MNSITDHLRCALIAVTTSLIVLPLPAQALPDLIVQDGVFNLDIVTRHFDTNDCVVLEGCAQPGLRRLLRLNTENRNIGDEDVVLGSPIGNTNFVFDSCHGHYHFEGYADYRLVSSNGVVAAGHKEGFCLEDVDRWDTNAALNAKYNCSFQGIQKGWADVYSQYLDCQWIDITDVEPGTYTLEVEVNPEHRILESNYSNNVTTAQVDIPPFPTVDIESPTNGLVSLTRLITVAGNLVSSNGVVSVVVTNSRGGLVDAVVAGTNWTADNVGLKVGTNQLSAIITDTLDYTASDSVTVVRVNTNYVDTTMRTTKVTLTLGATTNDNGIAFTGSFGQTGAQFNPATDSIEVMVGDFDATLTSNKLVNGKFKAAVSSSNSLTSVKLDLVKRTIAFTAQSFALTNLDPFPIALSLGTNDFGPDRITFPVPTNATGKFAWTYGKLASDLDQFFLTKGTLTINTFNLSGTLNVRSKPNVLTNDVTFGIGTYEEALHASGWTKSQGNVYSYKRPANEAGRLQTMKLDLDKGTWSATGTGADLSFLLSNATTDIRLEFEDFAATYPATFTPNGSKFQY